MSDHQSKHFRFTDIRALSELGFSGVHSITAIVEGVHQSVWRSIGVGKGEKTTGLTGLVYKLIHGTTSLFATGVSSALKQLEPFFESTDEKSSVARNQVLAILNGVLGDQLVNNKNSLGIKMGIHSRWNSKSKKHLLFIHGLCMNAHDWQSSYSYPEQLNSEYSIHYLNYNSGKHISDNGKELAEQLNDLIENASLEIEELNIVAHSMGGLVLRSALLYSEESAWVNKLKNVFFLGTPHSGAPLEQVGNWIDRLLSSNMYSKPFAKIGQLRSAGITDLRYGYISEDSWRGKDRFLADKRVAITASFPAEINFHFFAATLSENPNLLQKELLGDGLVPISSALLGKEPDSENSYLFYGINHIEMIHSEEVFSKIEGLL